MCLVLVTSDRFADHVTPPGHPERVARAHVMQAVTEKWAEQGIPIIAPRAATRDELLRVHTPDYVDRIAATAGRAVMLDPDTFTSPQTSDVAALAAGAAIVAVDAVISGEWRGASGEKRATSDPGPRTPDYAVAFVRPPGHHATAARAMGFCVYNNIAIAATHALARGLTRIAVVDFDVHHGNGTQWAFYEDPRVLFISTHQFPFYPGTGAATEAGSRDGQGFTVNIPLELGATDGDYALVFDRIVMPVLEWFGPQLLLVSAGFDGHQRDPLATMRMSVAGFNSLTARLHAFARDVSCPAVFITEGGYHLKALGACLDGLVRVLCGPDCLDSMSDERPHAAIANGAPMEPATADDAPLVEQSLTEPTHRGAAASDLVRSVQKQYWPGL